MALDTTGVKISFGKHKGDLVTRIPLSYLRWMVNNQTRQWEYGEAELTRRGAEEITALVSNHAIDRASIRALDIWKFYSNKDEGLHAWLMRITTEAITEGTHIEGEKFKYMKLTLIIAQGHSYPTLKTVIR